MDADWVAIIAGGVAIGAIGYAVERVVRSAITRWNKERTRSVTIEIARPGDRPFEVQLQPKDEQSIRSFLRAGEEGSSGHAPPVPG